MTPEQPAENGPSWGYTELGVFVFLSFLAVVLTQLAMGMLTRDIATLMFPSQLALYVVLLGVLAAILKLQFGRGFWESLAWVRSRVPLPIAAILGVAVAIAIALLGVAIHMPNTETPLQRLLEHRTTAIEFAIMGTTIGPLCEELVFRGFMQPVLVRSLGRAGGIIVTATVFGLLHLSQNAFAWQSGLLIALAGVAFGWMREISGSTRASTLMHAAYNFTFFLTLFAQGGHLPKK
jgi:membrane protease YdiL (CAAX protease family)